MFDAPPGWKPKVLTVRLYRPLLLLIACISAACGSNPPQSPVVTADITPTPTTAPAPTFTPTVAAPGTFDGGRAFGFVADQMEMGPRYPGSPGHTAVGDFIVDQLNEWGWRVEEQRFLYQGFEARNIIGKANEGRGQVIILGAHYDTRRLADQTPGAAEAGLPVPGAVDGASGVAVLLELARTLHLERIDRELWLAFFDVEDNGSGGIPGWEYIAGSTFMADQLPVTPEAMVLVDMVGDADQQLYYEGNSDPALRQEIWEIAAELGYNSVFIPEIRHTMIDDHLPFVMKGIPAVDIIDFDYPYWHTVEDDIDKVSPESLERVGRTLQVWLENHVVR